MSQAQLDREVAHLTGESVGFIWGLLIDASSLGLLGLHAVLYALAGYAAGMFRRQTIAPWHGGTRQHLAREMTAVSSSQAPCPRAEIRVPMPAAPPSADRGLRGGN